MIEITQEQVMESWPDGGCDKPIVSIICTAYNHAGYIEDTLDSFIMQKASYPFEILVHDDASTDRTADIIRKYEEKYPAIIKAVYQSENQYSKGVKISKTFLYPLIRGHYVAVCEGDDRWTDASKLQKQVDFLEENKEYSGCVCCAVSHDIKDSRLDFVLPNITKDRDYSTEEIIVHGGGIFATCTLIFRKEYLTMPDCFQFRYAGDFMWFIYFSIVGKVRCLSDVMAVYNRGVEGSWTERVERNDKAILEFMRGENEMMKRVDEYYGYRYHEAIQERIDRIDCIILCNEGKAAEAKKRYEVYYRERVRKLRINKLKRLVICIPGFASLWRAAKRLLLGNS